MRREYAHYWHAAFGVFSNQENSWWEHAAQMQSKIEIGQYKGLMKDMLKQCRPSAFDYFLQGNTGWFSQKTWLLTLHSTQRQMASSSLRASAGRCCHVIRPMKNLNLNLNFESIYPDVICIPPPWGRRRHSGCPILYDMMPHAWCMMTDAWCPMPDA